MTDDGPTRRGVLALAGSALLAGCNGVDGVFESDPPSVESGALREITAAGEPAAPETIPVDVERSALDDRRERARAFLDRIPTPLGPADLPNGAMREELTDRYERAEEVLAEADAATSNYRALETLREACKRARAASAAWRAIEGDLTREAVQSETSSLRKSITDFRRRWRYVGADPVRAAVVHATLESTLAESMRKAAGVENPRRRVEGPLAVGSLAADLEGASGALRDVRYLYGRFLASLDAPPTLRPRFEAAAESLVSRVESGRSNVVDSGGDELPSIVGGDVEDTYVGAAFHELYYGVEHAGGIRDDRAAGRLGSVALAARETLVYLGGYDTLKRRVEDDDVVRVESADDVRRLRSTAVEAVETATEAIGESPLGGVSERAAKIAYADDVLGRRDGKEPVSVDRLRRPLGYYLQATVESRVLPTVNATVAAALRGDG